MNIKFNQYQIIIIIDLYEHMLIQMWLAANYLGWFSTKVPNTDHFLVFYFWQNKITIRNLY
jgi:hypothetical protein